MAPVRPHSLGREHRLIKAACLNCGLELEAAAAIDADAGPSAGDVTICVGCGHVMAFTEAPGSGPGQVLSLRELTEEEKHAIAGDERVLAFQRVRKCALP